MRSGNTTPLCAIEDWSGAGFHTKQPLNVGQPIVSQVVSSPNNQSCLDPSLRRWTQQQAHSVGCVIHGVATTKSEQWNPPGHHLWCPVWSEGTLGRNGKQASASKILLSWARGLFGDGDISKAAPPGIEPVNPLWSSRFLLMQTHVGYRLA